MLSIVINEQSAPLFPKAQSVSNILFKWTRGYQEKVEFHLRNMTHLISLVSEMSGIKQKHNTEQNGAHCQLKIREKHLFTMQVKSNQKG